MQTEGDCEIENHGGTRMGPIFFVFWSFVMMGMRAIFAQLNGCSSVGNEPTQSNQSHSFCIWYVIVIKSRRFGYRRP